MDGVPTTGMAFYGDNEHYFTHQSDRLQQVMVNHVVMIRTFKGICSDLPEMMGDGMLVGKHIKGILHRVLTGW